ncbi:hypothetical protein NC651_029818 [Populus alba x Populus x berolinensis]|nr:hypothetical protein NC651_029818 [Populus alba x Populus x berolinensis]
MLTLPSDRGLECSAAISNLYPNRKPYMQSSNMFSDPHTSNDYSSMNCDAPKTTTPVKLIIYTGWETSEIVDVIHDIKHIMGDVLFRYTAKNFVKFGGARDTDHPAIRQPSALDIWTNLLFA